MCLKDPAKTDQTPAPNQPRIVARDLILKEMILTQLPAMPAARPVPISKKADENAVCK